MRVLHAHGHDGAVPLQLAITQAKAQPLAAHGRPTTEEQELKGDHITFKRGTTGAAYLLRRLARDAPEVLDQIGPDKEFKSARAAAIEAGIIKPVPTLRAKAASSESAIPTISASLNPVKLIVVWPQA